MVELLCRFVQRFEEFRLPELEALAQMTGTTVSYDAECARRVRSLLPEDEMPLLAVRFESREAAAAIAARSIALKAVFEVWGEGATLDEAVADTLRRHPAEDQDALVAGSTFHIKFDAFGRHVDRPEQAALFDRTRALRVWTAAAVKMHKPAHCFHVISDCGPGGFSMPSGVQRAVRRVLFCRKVHGGARGAIDVYSLRRRAYLGSTSMNPELALFMANQGLVRSGSLCFDPFVGTGGIALACAHFGGRVLGCDISSPTLRGTGPNKNVRANFRQYQLEPRLLDLVILDNAHSPLRKLQVFDAIVCDPPYGVRAGARKIGPIGDGAGASSPSPAEMEQRASRRKQRRDAGLATFPHCVPYGVPEMTLDLLQTAAQMLRIGGRLVFWAPSTVEYRESDLPHHPCFRLVANSLQQITLRWGRRLLTMEKTLEFDPELHGNLVPADVITTSGGGGAVAVADGFFDFVFSPEDHPVAAAEPVQSGGMDPRMLEHLKRKSQKKAAERAKQQKPHVDESSK